MKRKPECMRLVPTLRCSLLRLLEVRQTGYVKGACLKNINTTSYKHSLSSIDLTRPPRIFWEHLSPQPTLIILDR